MHVLQGCSLALSALLAVTQLSKVLQCMEALPPSNGLGVHCQTETRMHDHMQNHDVVELVDGASAPQHLELQVVHWCWGAFCKSRQPVLVL